MIVLYTTPAGMQLPVDACIKCPDHKSIYHQEKAGIAWHSKLVNVYCRKLGCNVCLTGIDPKCPLIVEARAKQEEDRRVL